MSSNARMFTEYGAIGGISAMMMYSIYHQLSSSYWLSALVEKSNEYYPLVGHRGNDLRIVGESESPLESQNIGLKIQGPIFTDAETVVLYRELKRFVLEHGSDLGARYQKGIKGALESAGLDESALDGARVFCPISVGDSTYIPNRKVFGPGDALRLSDVPPYIRYLASEMKKTHPVSLGMLRHVMIEYYPSGKPFCHPRRIPEFAGYDCFVLPIRAPKFRETPFVVTMTPTLRSKRSDMQEIAAHSWSTRDWDALLHKGCVLHIHSQARMEWRYAYRPLQWFGSPANEVSEVFTELVRAQPWWRAAFSRVPILSSVLLKPSAKDVVAERVYATCPPELKDDKGIILVTVGFSGAELAPRRMAGMPESVYFGARPPDERRKWDDDGKHVWAPIEWDEIQSFADVKDIVLRRVGAMFTRNTAASVLLPTTEK